VRNQGGQKVGTQIALAASTTRRRWRSRAASPRTMVQSIDTIEYEKNYKIITKKRKKVYHHPHTDSVNI
jgi:hypothetical protein